jgi:sirohydrochlorin cobaltochelatase
MRRNLYGQKAARLISRIKRDIPGSSFIGPGIFFWPGPKNDTFDKRRRCMVKRLLLMVLLGSALVCVQAYAGHHGKPCARKDGILLVAFGSSLPEAQVAFENIDRQVTAAFPNVPVRWAYTSHIIREKLAAQGRQLDSVAMALAKMKDAGFTHVAVQSLHTIRGEEFDNLVATTRAFGHMPEGFRRITVGAPLLSTQADIERVAAAILTTIPTRRHKQDAVVLMGHGSHHPANAFYAALMFNLQLQDPNVFVGTVEGAPEIDVIQTLLAQNKIQKVYLMPFMSVAGDHARNDMAGPEEDSWKSILTRAGFQCEAVLKGTAEYDPFVAIWLDHLKAAYQQLCKRHGHAAQ